MSYRGKLLLALLVAAAVPMGVIGWVADSAVRAQLTRAAEAQQRQEARDIATAVRAHVLGSLDGLRLALDYLPLGDVRSEQLQALLTIPLHQLKHLSLLAALDAQGAPVVPPVVSGDLPGDQEHEVAAFRSRLPLRTALEKGAAIGTAWRPAGSDVSRVPLALRLPPGARGRAEVVGAELSLAELQRRVSDTSHGSRWAVVVDNQGTPRADARRAFALAAWEQSFVDRALGARVENTGTVRRSDGTKMLATFAPVSDLGWGVIVARPLAEILAPAEPVRQSVALSGLAALAACIVASVLLARRVNQPVAELARAAAALSKGQYEQRAEVCTRDEFGRLAEAFNRMAEEIGRRDEEIRAWGREQQQRVNEQTELLREAQDQIERARRLAGLHSLSAGIAHELNTPLTAIVGMLSLMKRDLADDPNRRVMFDQVFEQAQRMTGIIEEMRRLADAQQVSGQRFDPAVPLQAALEEMRQTLDSKHISVELKTAPGSSEVQGDAEQLRQVFGHLLQNAATAMPSGGQLSVELMTVGSEAVRIRVRDTGKGIPPALRERIFDPFFTTKDEPGRVGLGLSVCHRIVEDHQGRILVHSEPGRGAAFTVVLPIASQAHLR